MADTGTITIGGETRTLADAGEGWITQQVNRRNTAGVPVCVEVKLKTSGIDVRLATPACGGGGGGGRPPNRREQDVFDLWMSHHLNSGKFSGGDLIAFVKQLRRLL